MVEQPLSRSSVLLMLQEHLARELKVQAGEIGVDTDIYVDLGGDSWDVVTLESEIYAIYRVRVSFGHASVVSVGEIIDAILERSGQGGSAIA